MYDKPTRRFGVLILTMYLTLVIGLSAVTENQATETKNRDGGKPAGYSLQLGTNTTPKRHSITKNKLHPEYVRSQARIWFLQREHLDEWKCIDTIIHRESRWIPNLWNSQGSNAYGLGQVKESYPYTHNKPMKQFIRAVKYAIHKYGTMCKALTHHDQHGWY